MMQRKHEIDFTFKSSTDVFNYCREKLNKDRPYNKRIHLNIFTKVITTFFNVVYERAIEGEIVELPFKQGKIFVNKVVLMRKLRFVTTTLNNASEYIPLFFWDRPAWAKIYTFKGSHIFNRRLFKKFREGYDYPEVENYEFFHKRYS